MGIMTLTVTKPDYGEVADMAIMHSYSQLEMLYRTYNEKYASMEGESISEATQKIGFACENKVDLPEC